MVVCSFILCPSECLSVCLGAIKFIIEVFEILYYPNPLLDWVYIWHVDKSPNCYFRREPSRQHSCEAESHLPKGLGGDNI